MVAAALAARCGSTRLSAIPSPCQLPVSAPARVLGCGAFLKNSACIVDGDRVTWSALHGDLVDAASCRLLEASVDSLCRQARGRLHAIAHDLHPDFYSTRLAGALASQLRVPAIPVQHHHAHIAAVVAARGIAGPVIGIALDGVGLGDDGLAWGGELLWVGGARAVRDWRRVAHLQPLLLPGGDAAAREPWRLAAALLHEGGRGDEIVSRFAPIVGQQAARIVQSMLARKLNCPSTSSAGRWFDAAAGVLGLSVRQAAEAEAARALEARATDWLRRHPGFERPWDSLDLRPIVEALFDIASDDAEGVARGAAGFHLALVGGLAQAATIAARETSTREVVLGGGCFQNRLLRERLGDALRAAGLRVHLAPAADCGDSGLALGQAWVGAYMLD